LGGVSSRLLDHLHYDDFASDDDIGYADDDYEDRSIQAVTIMVEAIRMFGISPQHKKHGSQEGTANLSTAPTVTKHGETEQGGPPPGQPLEVKVKTISLRVVGEGFRFLSLLAAGEAEAMKSILEHDVLALSILALRAHKMLVQMILVATPLCLTILRADPRAMEACLRMQYHLLLVDLLGLHPDNALVIEASLTGLKVLAFKAPHVQKDLERAETMQRLGQILHSFRDNPQVVCKGMGLLCNLARSAECSALMVEHGVVALIAGSLLRHQDQDATVKYGVWALFNILLQPLIPLGKVEQAVTNGFPAIVMHVMSLHLENACVQGGCCGLIGILSRAIPNFLEPFVQMGADEAVKMAFQRHKAHQSVHVQGQLALKILAPALRRATPASHTSSSQYSN